MYQKFNEYRQRRELASLDQRLNTLCETLALSGLQYDEWWTGVGLPTMLNEAYEDEEQLLNEFLGGLGQKIGQFFGGGQRPQVGVDDAANVAAMGGQPALSADTQAKISASTDRIKQELSRSMQNIIAQMKQNRDSVGFQVASKLSQRLDQMLGSLSWKKGEGKFDHAAAFGASANTGAGQDTGDRWKQMLSNPQTAQKVAQQYAQKLGVQPDQIMKLIQAGHTNPSEWPGIFQAHQQMHNPTPAPEPAPQDTNADYKAALSRMAQRPTGGSATGMPMRTAAMGKY